jgi:hypothetical protein
MRRFRRAHVPLPNSLPGKELRRSRTGRGVWPSICGKEFLDLKEGRNVNIMRTTVVACIAALAAFATPASADSFDAFTSTITTGTTGNGKGRQTLRDFSLGLDFEVTFDHVTITRLGVWDDNGNGLLSSHVLMLYDLSNPSAPLAQINTLPGAGVLVNGYRYFDLLDPITLGAGTQFSVVVYYPGDNLDSNGNSGPTPPSLNEPTPIFDGEGVISNIGVGRYVRDLAFPDMLDTGPANRYHSGSFTYSPNPEPGTMVLLSGVLAAAGVWRRRRAKRR